MCRKEIITHSHRRQPQYNNRNNKQQQQENQNENETKTSEVQWLNKVKVNCDYNNKWLHINFARDVVEWIKERVLHRIEREGKSKNEWNKMLYKWNICKNRVAHKWRKQCDSCTQQQQQQIINNLLPKFFWIILNLFPTPRAQQGKVNCCC